MTRSCFLNNNVHSKGGGPAFLRTLHSRPTPFLFLFACLVACCSTGVHAQNTTSIPTPPPPEGVSITPFGQGYTIGWLSPPLNLNDTGYEVEYRVYQLGGLNGEQLKTAMTAPAPWGGQVGERYEYNSIQRNDGTTLVTVEYCVVTVFIRPGTGEAESPKACVQRAYLVNRDVGIPGKFFANSLGAKSAAVAWTPSLVTPAQTYNDVVYNLYQYVAGAGGNDSVVRVRSFPTNYSTNAMPVYLAQVVNNLQDLTAYTFCVTATLSDNPLSETQLVCNTTTTGMPDDIAVRNLTVAWNTSMPTPDATSLTFEPPAASSPDYNVTSDGRYALSYRVFQYNRTGAAYLGDIDGTQLNARDFGSVLSLDPQNGVCVSTILTPLINTTGVTQYVLSSDVSRNLMCSTSDSIANAYGQLTSYSVVRQPGSTNYDVIYRVIPPEGIRSGAFLPQVSMYPENTPTSTSVLQSQYDSDTEMWTAQYTGNTTPLGRYCLQIVGSPLSQCTALVRIRATTNTTTADGTDGTSRVAFAADPYINALGMFVGVANNNPTQVINIATRLGEQYISRGDVLTNPFGNLFTVPRLTSVYSSGVSSMCTAAIPPGHDGTQLIPCTQQTSFLSSMLPALIAQSRISSIGLSGLNMAVPRLLANYPGLVLGVDAVRLAAVNSSTTTSSSSGGGAQLPFRLGSASGGISRNDLLPNLFANMPTLSGFFPAYNVCMNVFSALDQGALSSCTTASVPGFTSAFSDISLARAPSHDTPSHLAYTVSWPWNFGGSTSALAPGSWWQSYIQNLLPGRSSTSSRTTAGLEGAVVRGFTGDSEDEEYIGGEEAGAMSEEAGSSRLTHATARQLQQWWNPIGSLTTPTTLPASPLDAIRMVIGQFNLAANTPAEDFLSCTSVANNTVLNAACITCATAEYTATTSYSGEQCLSTIYGSTLPGPTSLTVSAANTRGFTASWPTTYPLNIATSSNVYLNNIRVAAIPIITSTLTGSTTQTYTFSGLLPYTAYQACVTFYLSSSETTQTCKSTRTRAEKPSQPASANFAASSDTAILVSWAQSTYLGGGTAADVLYAVVLNAQPSTRKTLRGDSSPLSLSMTGLTRATPYSVCLTATVDSNSSLPLCSTVTTETSATSPPNTVASSPLTSSTVDLTWAAPDDLGGSTLCNIYYLLSVNASSMSMMSPSVLTDSFGNVSMTFNMAVLTATLPGYWTATIPACVSATTTQAIPQATIAGLARYSQFQVCVTALLNGKVSAPSCASTRTRAEVPRAPRNLRVGTDTSTSLWVTADAASDFGGATAADAVYTLTIGDSSFTISAMDPLSYSISDLQRYTVYNCCLSTSVDGFTSDRQCSAIRTLAEQPTSPVTVTTRDTTTGSTTLSWYEPYDLGGAESVADVTYRVYNGAGSSAVLLTSMQGTTVAAYRVTNLVRYTSYTFCVTTAFSAFESAPACTTMRTKPSQPRAPSNLLVSVTAMNTITLSWTSSSDFGGAPASAAEYRVYINNGAVPATTVNGAAQAVEISGATIPYRVNDVCIATAIESLTSVRACDDVCMISACDNGATLRNDTCLCSCVADFVGPSCGEPFRLDAGLRVRPSNTTGLPSLAAELAFAFPEPWFGDGTVFAFRWSMMHRQYGTASSSRLVVSSADPTAMTSTTTTSYSSSSPISATVITAAGDVDNSMTTVVMEESEEDEDAYAHLATGLTVAAVPQSSMHTGMKNTNVAAGREVNNTSSSMRALAARASAAVARATASVRSLLPTSLSSSSSAFITDAHTGVVIASSSDAESSSTLALETISTTPITTSTDSRIMRTGYTDETTFPLTTGGITDVTASPADRAGFRNYFAVNNGISLIPGEEYYLTIVVSMERTNSDGSRTSSIYATRSTAPMVAPRITPEGPTVIDDGSDDTTSRNRTIGIAVGVILIALAIILIIICVRRRFRNKRKQDIEIPDLPASPVVTGSAIVGAGMHGASSARLPNEDEEAEESSPLTQLEVLSTVASSQTHSQLLNASSSGSNSQQQQQQHGAERAGGSANASPSATLASLSATTGMLHGKQRGTGSPSLVSSSLSRNSSGTGAGGSNNSSLNGSSNNNTAPSSANSAGTVIMTAGGAAHPSVRGSLAPPASAAFGGTASALAPPSSALLGHYFDLFGAGGAGAATASAVSDNDDVVLHSTSLSPQLQQSFVQQQQQQRQQSQGSNGNRSQGSSRSQGTPGSNKGSQSGATSRKNRSGGAGGAVSVQGSDASPASGPTSSLL